ncbi:MAG: alkaline phosphatase family protein [Bacteroidota bacterium]|nr:alkaline phosphatase family protein [Bacteroidota bacterium]
MDCIARFILVVGICLLAACKHKSDTPRPDHVIVVIEENHGYDQLIGSKIASFLNQLADSGALFTDAHGIIHPSQPNYLAIFSGSIQGITDDKCLEKETPYTTPNLGASLIQKGLTFKGYAQTMPSAGFTGCSFMLSELTGSYLYARKHVPWVNWQGNKKNNFPASLSVPMTEFPTDFSQLPTVAFVIPDQDHDMHNIGDPGDSAAIHRADQWLLDNLGAYAEWAKTHNSLLIVTFDEDDFTKENRIPTIFYGPMVKPGKFGERINHYSVLHTLEAMYDLPVTDSTGAPAIKDIWVK